MAKKFDNELSTGISVGDDLPLSEGGHKRYSKALKRVMNVKKEGEPILRGIYLSSKQIVNLGNALKKMKREFDGPDGVCFMIGYDTDTLFDTVEIIPFKRQNIVDEPAIKFYKANGEIGNLDEINLGFPFSNGGEVILDGNGLWFPHQHEGPGVPHHIVGQHTPPPFAD